MRREPRMNAATRTQAAGKDDCGEAAPANPARKSSNAAAGMGIPALNGLTAAIMDCPKPTAAVPAGER